MRPVEQILADLDDPIERAVVRSLAERADEILDFTCELIRTPSVNPPGDESLVAAVVLDRLRAIGITDAEIVADLPDRPNVVAAIGSAEAGRSIMFSGHIDTKPPGDLSKWRTDPFEPTIVDGELVGLGSGDMKASIAAMIYAAGALVDAGEVPGRMALVLTADEENGSTYGSKWLAERGLVDSEVCVIGEPGGVHAEWESLHLVSRGCALFRVHVTGTQMHSSISDQLPAVNATLKMSELALRMQRHLRSFLTFDDHPLCDHGPTVNVGVTAEAGVTFGVYPGLAILGCDIRTLPGMDEEQVRADVQRFLDAAMADDPDLQARLEWVTMVAATEIPADHPVVPALQEAATVVLGHRPRLAAFPGATDAAYIQRSAGIPCVASFGPGYLPRAHSPNESLGVDGPVEAAIVYALAALRYLRSAD